jgi:hypothetical protein
MNYTPRTDALEKIDRNEWDKDPHSPEERFDYFLVYDIAREFERELAAKDAGIASMRAQMREADKKMLRFHRLEDELAASEKEIARLRVLLGNLNREASKSHITSWLGDATAATTAYVIEHDYPNDPIKSNPDN